ncbi:MAG TPA: hypothetical protein VFO38_03955 [Candidatus Saccharimonadales bacterium]|nr:hypothetical protein [Candidatus Saccharimonadales bacterium]
MQKKYNQRGVKEIVIALMVVVLGFGVWYVWQDQTQKSQTVPGTNSPAASQGKIFKMPELGVEFYLKGNIIPLYAIVNPNGVGGTTVSLSTQQVVEKGLATTKTGKNECLFDKTNLNSSFVLLHFNVYATKADAAMAKSGPGDHPLPTDQLTAENGFITVGDKIYYVPQGITGGNSNCLPDDSSFLSQQWNLLRESLMSLRASR